MTRKKTRPGPKRTAATLRAPEATGDGKFVSCRFDREQGEAIDDESARMGVTASKVIRDAVAIAMAFREGTLVLGVLPGGVACFMPRKDV
ncbi:MAG: hypothetical protein ABIF82_09550 [Planctomycetota bacterium]